MTLHDSEMYECALGIALDAHKGQKDKLGCSYIDHPIRVSQAFSDYTLKTIAILHDTLEDSEVVGYYLKMFPDEIRTTLDLLTHSKYDSYEKYINKLTVSELAVKVKIQDLLDNTDPVRVSELYKVDKETSIRVSKKYVWALMVLKDLYRGD